MDIQGLCSRLLILVVAFLGGGGSGAAVGAMVGIIPSLSQIIAPSIIATYAFSGLLAGSAQTYRLLRILNDPTLIRYEREMRMKRRERIPRAGEPQRM